MRKIISILLLAACVLGLGACGADKGEGGESSSSYELHTSIPGLDEPRGGRVLTIAGLGASNLDMYALEFNNDPERDFTVKFVDYQPTGIDWDTAAARLKADLAAGKAPDMIDFDAFPSQDIYARQGLLRDMSDYFYDEFELDEFYTLDVLNPTGALYFFPANFQIITAYGSPKIFAGKSAWSISDYEQLSRLPQFAESPADTQESFLSKLHEYMIPAWVDLQQGVCRYDDGSFADALRFAATLGIEPLNYAGKRAAMVGSGQLLYSETWIRSPLDIKTIEKAMGSPASFIGVPTPDGSFGSSILTFGLAGVNAATENADLAWEFIRYMMTEGRFVHDEKMWDNIPVLKAAAEEKMAFDLNPYAEFAGKTIVINDDGTFEADGVHQDMTYDPSPVITEEQAKAFYQLIERTTHVYAQDSAAYEIMMDCARQYLAGDKSLEDTVTNAQSRTGIYLAEQCG